MLHTVTTGLCTVVPVPVGSCVGTWFVSFNLKVSCESWDNVLCCSDLTALSDSAAVLSGRPPRPQPQGYSKQNKTPELIASDCV